MAVVYLDPISEGLPTNFTLVGDTFAGALNDYASGGALNTADYIQGAHAASANVFLVLSTTPSTFDPGGVTQVRVRVHATTVHGGISAGTDNISIRVGLFSDNGATALSNQVTLSEPTGEHYITLTMNSGLTKSQYDNMRLGVYQVYAAAGCADATAYLVVNATQLEITYTVPPPSIVSFSVSDSGRNWDNSTQDVVVNFSRATTAANPVAGYFFNANGANVNCTYVSGAGTAQWVFRIPVLMRNGQTISVIYNDGSTVAVDDGQALPNMGFTPQSGTNNLTKRIREILYSSTGTPVTAENVNCCVYSDATAMVMGDQPPLTADGSRVQITPSAAGVIDFQYTGESAVGATRYMVAVRSTETVFARVTVK